MSTKCYSTGNHILVGLGGTGGKILRAFKMRMFEEFPDSEERSKHPVSLLYVDSTTEMMPRNGRARPDFKVMGQDASFTNNEFLNIKAVDVEHLLDHINNYPMLKGIVDNVTAVKSAIGSLGEAAGQKRRAGRLLFAANAVGYVNSLKNAFARANEVSENEDHTTFHIFAGLSGGTGSGAIIDAIIQTRKAFPDAKILVYAMIPEMNLPKADMDQGRYYQNGYAAVKEINALQAGRWFPQDVTGRGQAKLFNFRVKGVADGVTFYSNVNENGVSLKSLTDLPKIVSDYVFARIFYINEGNMEANGDIIRAYKFENMDEFALEYDEVGNPDKNGQLPIARTKKLNSFGIKRVIYPELRVLKHMTYTIGQSVLWQFKYNNWRENQGFVNEERNRDLRQEFLNKDKLAKWMLDTEHLTLDKKILPSDPDYPSFKEYWKNRVADRSEEAKDSDNPLNELDRIMGTFFDDFFREEGVKRYFDGKNQVIPEMALEIRRNIEREFFEKWNNGDISISELKKLSSLLIAKLDEKRKEIDELLKKEKDNFVEIDEERIRNVDDWTHLGIFQRMVNKGARLYEDHQQILIDLYESKTRLIALEFAQKLVAKVFLEISRMDSDISSFGQKISDAIDLTDRLIANHQKVNKGLEDKREAIIEVSEEERMAEFEKELKSNKTDMITITREIREAIIPQMDFVNFGDLANIISEDEIADAFDTQLARTVRTKHDERPETEKKVLGLNILTQLQQKLRTDDDIKAFATEIVQQSGAYLKLNDDQVRLSLRNNEGNLSPSNPASMNKKVILVSIPSPSDNVQLQKFVKKLVEAFKNSVDQNTSRTQVNVYTESPRTDELSIITVNYCFPVRAIDWLRSYKTRYDQFLDTGNPATDTANNILLHSEGKGSDLPPVFAVDNAEEVALEAKRKEEEEAAAAAQQSAQNAAAQQTAQNAATPPPMSGPATPPPMAGPATPPPMPNISVYLHVAGQQYGPFNYKQCEEMYKNRQLNPQTLTWIEGMPSWAPASQVEALAPIFAPVAPAMPPASPAMPPASPTMPPAM